MPVCNKSKNCSVSTSKESTGWKAGVSVCYIAQTVTRRPAQSLGRKRKEPKRKQPKPEEPKRKITAQENILCLAKKWK